MVNAQIARPVSSSWTFRIYGAIPAEPAWVGVGIGVGLLAIYFGAKMVGPGIAELFK